MKLSAKIACCCMVLIFLLYAVPALGSNQPVNVTFVIGTTHKTVLFEQDSFIGAYPLSPDDYPADAVSFRGWYVSENPGPNEQPVDLAVTKATGGNQVFYAKFSSEYLVKFLDGDLLTVLYSKEVTPNSVIPAYGGTVQPYAGAGYTFTNWYITDSTMKDVPVTPGETPVTKDLILKPAFTSQRHYVYFVSLGTQVSPGLVDHGQAITQPPAPERAGYKFNGWSTSVDDSTITYNFNDPVNSDLVLYAQWVSDSDIPYTIALWMEKPNLSSDLKKDDIDISQFDYVDSVQGFGDAGETISFTDLNLTPEVREMLKGESSPLSVLRYAEFFASDTKSIAGNGSTVVNLYFSRKVYSWDFVITDPDYSMSVAGSVYQETEYTMEAKYEEDISDKYPVAPIATFYKNGENTADFKDWLLRDPYFITDNNYTISWVGKRIYVGEDMLSRDGQKLNYQAAEARFDANQVIYNYRYFAQTLPGETADITRTYNGRSMGFKLMDEYSQKVKEITILKTIPGFTGLNNSSVTYQEDGGSYIEGDGENSVRCFFYERNIYNLTFNANKPSNAQGNVTGMPASPSVNKMYGEDIGSAPADPKLDGYEFVGWYKDAGGIAVQDFNTPIPNSNLAVYAKWHKDDHKLVFKDGYPSDSVILSTTIGENECVSYSRYASSPDNLPQIGDIYQGKQLAGWMWEIPGTNFLTEFSETIPVHNDTILYARWKTAGYKVTYSTGSGGGTPPEDPLDYNRDAQTRLLAPIGIVPPYGQVFIGWTIGNSLYHEDNIITITGNMEAVATFSSPQQLVTVTYHKNLGETTDIKTYYAQKNSDINLFGSEAFTDSAKQLVGWQDAAGSTHALGASYHVSDANVDLYGLWENKTFAIIYYQNQDSNDLTSFEQQIQATGQLYSILAFDAITPAFVAPAGYLFSSWNTAPDGMGIDYAVGANVSISETSLRLYAQYVIKDPEPIDGLTIIGNDFTIYNTQVPESATDPQYITWAKAIALFNQIAIPDQNTYITIDASKVQTASGIYPVSFTVNYQDQSASVTVNCTVTRSNDGGGGGGGGGGSTSTGSEKNNTIDIGDTPTPLAFISDHIQYLYGYPGGNVRPDSSITRAEAAAIFHRLLANTDKNNSVTSTLNDVSNNNWFYQAVAYLNKYGIITGYPDGFFRPNQGITRAEFAAIAARFDELAPSGNNFSDVSSSYWAAEYIGSAATKGWIGGFPDGTFGPTQQITRAQVVSIVNRMLDRRTLAADVPSEAPKYNDLASSHWAYADISEASCSHTYHIKNDGGTEMWDSISEVPIANANSIAAADYVYGETNQSLEETERESTEEAEESIEVTEESAQAVEETTETTEE